jgi:hypothetical protein
MLNVWGSSYFVRMFHMSGSSYLVRMLHVWGSSCLLRNVAVMPFKTHRAWLCFCVWKMSSNVFIFTNFNAMVLTFCVCFWWIRTWPNGWQVILPHSHAIVQTALSLMWFCLSSYEVDYFHVLWSSIPPQSLNVYYAFKKCILLMNSWVLCFQRLHYTLIAGV